MLSSFQSFRPWIQIFLGFNAVVSGTPFPTFRRVAVPSCHSTQHTILADLHPQPQCCENQTYHFWIHCPFLIPHSSHAPTFDHPRGSLTLNAEPNQTDVEKKHTLYNGHSTAHLAQMDPCTVLRFCYTMLSTFLCLNCLLQLVETLWSAKF
jgi:hypothetical protein